MTGVAVDTGAVGVALCEGENAHRRGNSVEDFNDPTGEWCCPPLFSLVVCDEDHAGCYEGESALRHDSQVEDEKYWCAVAVLRYRLVDQLKDHCEREENLERTGDFDNCSGTNENFLLEMVILFVDENLFLNHEIMA